MIWLGHFVLFSFTFVQFVFFVLCGLVGFSLVLRKHFLLGVGEGEASGKGNAVNAHFTMQKSLYLYSFVSRVVFCCCCCVVVLVLQSWIHLALKADRLQSRKRDWPWRWAPLSDYLLYVALLLMLQGNQRRHKRNSLSLITNYCYRCRFLYIFTKRYRNSKEGYHHSVVFLVFILFNFCFGRLVLVQCDFYTLHHGRRFYFERTAANETKKERFI